jgi:hypothetical protein
LSEPELYRAALTVMMRLVFLFSAEERGLLLLGDPLYDEHYAVSTLVARLQETADQQGEEILERRHDAWVRLLSTFRAVFGGVQHERMKLLPYAGNLFDPDQFPFLEGRKPGTTWKDTPATPLLIDNRTVLHLLRSLQYLELHGEARRLSFRALDIEQIGHVYEGLLDHTAKRATEPVLSLTAAKGDEPEVALSELERIKAKGEAELLKFLKEQTGRSESALAKALVTPKEGVEAKKLRAACGNDDALFNRVRPFSGLVRNDTFDRPVVIRKGSVYVTAGTDRRSSGTHYTPRSLTEPIVQYTLESLVYIGPAEGKPKEEWKLRSAKEMLDLKICDMACGSGAFLVQVCRYLAERLLEAWEDAEKRHPGVPGITPEGSASTGAANERLIPRDTDERLAYARRLVAQRCLYGVDKNPLAAEMAKLSLWLLTLAKYKPFTFLDHAIRCGDSLIGIRDIRQVQYFQLDLDHADRSLFAGPVMSLVDEAVVLRKKIEALPANTVEDVREKERLLAEAEEKTARLPCAADLLISVEFEPVSSAGEKEALHNSMAIQAGHYVQNGTLEDFRAAAQKVLNGQRTFHWPLEFPEVIVDRGGFDAIVCNPPFMGGSRVSNNFGSIYRNYLVSQVASGTKGRCDLCAYFFLRGFSLLNSYAALGMLATNSISEGDTREVGLDEPGRQGASIFRTTPNLRWPGEASLFITCIWLWKGVWKGEYFIHDRKASGINTLLSDANLDMAAPSRLAENTGIALSGSYVYGQGFVLSIDEARSLLLIPENKTVVYPYLIGDAFNSRPDQSFDRYVINFFDWPLSRGDAAKGYAGPCASDFPECLRIVRERVKPERDRVNEKRVRELWWQYGRRAVDLYEVIRGKQRVLFHAFTSKYMCFGFVDSSLIFAQPHIVIALHDGASFAVLQSGIHGSWVDERCSRMKTDIRYVASDVFDTFARPHLSMEAQVCLNKVGDEYHGYRGSVTLTRQIGLTACYNLFHDPYESAPDIQKLRDLHVEMDNAVAAAYGWTDLDLGHGFHETKQGIRFTISESARREVLARLLKLNHERYAEEVAQGLHEKRKGGKGRGKMKAANEADFPSLFS